MGASHFTSDKLRNTLNNISPINIEGIECELSFADAPIIGAVNDGGVLRTG